MTEYIGISVGPIVDAIERARKPAELWGCSYLFSYIMKRLVIEMVDQATGRVPIHDIISPYIDDEGKILHSHNHVGLFHDRLIMKAAPGRFERLQEWVQSVLEDTGKCLFRCLTEQDVKAEGLTLEEVVVFLKDYISFVYAQCAVDEPRNVVKQVNDLLDVLEQRRTFPQEETRPLLLTLLQNDRMKYSYLLADASEYFGDSVLVKPSDPYAIYDIPSIAEVQRRAMPPYASWEIDFDHNRKAFTYYAVVYADGDNMGATLKTCETIEDVRAFSHKCLQYGQRAAACIREHKAMPIYAGGDDLLFLAPITDLFLLLAAIDQIFGEVFRREIDASPVGSRFSVSFGVSVQYHKFPLYEALSRARTLLFDVAKDVPLGSPKDAIAFQMELHSGQQIGFNLKKAGGSLASLQQLLSDTIAEAERAAQMQSPSPQLQSVQYKLEDMRALFDLSLDEEKSSSDAFHHAFQNLFRDEVHKANRSYLQRIETLIQEIQSGKLPILPLPERMVMKKPWHMKPPAVVQSVLSLAKFMIEKEGENEHA